MQITLATWLTLGRMAAVPVFAALAFSADDWARWAGLVVFVAAAGSDYFDGMLARARGEVSDLGRCLDPIADKLLVVGISVTLVAQDHVVGVHVLAVILILCREIAVAGLREFLGGIQVSIPVSRLAKWKTGVQLTALGSLILGPAGPELLYLPVVGVALLWIAAALTVWTGWEYLRGSLHVLLPETRARTEEQRRNVRPPIGGNRPASANS